MIAAAMLIAMTGATGFLGESFARALCARGHSLRCLVRTQSHTDGLRALRVALQPGDLCDERSLRALVRGVDAIVHAAMDHAGHVRPPSVTPRETYLRNNLFGGELLIEFARQERVPRFLLISSLEVYGSQPGAPCAPRDETAPLWPDSVYGSVKYALETTGLCAGEDHGFQVVRPGWVFGARPLRASHCWHPIVDRLLAGDDLPVNVGAYMIWVEDLARIVAELLERPIGSDRVFNAHSGFLDWHRVTEIGKQLFESRSRITGQPAPPPSRPITAERIKQLAMPFRVEDGVRRTLEHIARLSP